MTLHVNLISIMQEIDFLRIGRVVRLDTDKGWCYAACSKCSKKLQRTASAFACGRCNNLHGAGALRRVASLLNNYVNIWTGVIHLYFRSIVLFLVNVFRKA